LKLRTRSTLAAERTRCSDPEPSHYLHRDCHAGDMVPQQFPIPLICVFHRSSKFEPKRATGLNMRWSGTRMV
jgi:hypothetical protein